MAEDNPEAGDPRIVTRTEHNQSTSFRDNASGPPSEGKSVTGRPNDLQWGKVPANSTLADRAKRQTTKQVRSEEDVEDKAVKRATRK